MPTPLHVLILEDSPADVELMLHELRRAGFEPLWQRVATEPDFLARLAPPPDIILADYALSQFDALRALRCVQERAPDISLIVVTGALSDEAAVACLKQGAAEYLLKDCLGRLGEAVRQALAARDLRVPHRQAHDALRVSEERFRALSEQASDLVGILDADGTYRYASPSHQRILGDAPAEVQSRNVFGLIHPEDVPYMQAAFAALLQSPGAMEAVEFRMRHADGSWRTLEGIGTNRLHDPALQGIIANAHDITERKRAEAERTFLLAREHETRQAAERAAERTQRLLSVTAALATALTSDQVADVIITRGLAALDATQGIVVVLSDDGTVLRTLRLVGYPQEVFEAWREFVAETRVPIADAVREREELVLASWEECVARYPHLVGIQAPGGTSAMIALPLIVGDRAIGGIGLSLPEGRHVDAEDRAFMRALADLYTQAFDRGRLYDAEQRARLEAETAVQERDAFLSVAAHELKTPVTSLCGFAQLLLLVMKGETRIDAPQVRGALHRIDTQAMKLDGLIARLLDLSRIEAGQLSLDTQVVDLTAVVQGVVAAAQARTSAHTLVVDAPAPIAARLDPLRFEQVLVNLVNNAIKYSPDGGTIDIALTQHGDTVQVAVRDHGLGIPPEHRGHIFDRFYQAHACSHRSGVGLGLYISRQIVDLHGGSITANFPVDGGTQFVVTLPVSYDASQLSCRSDR
jgi:PAS domain S-box-containing protein